MADKFLQSPSTVELSSQLKSRKTSCPIKPVITLDQIHPSRRMVLIGGASLALSGCTIGGSGGTLFGRDKTSPESVEPASTGGGASYSFADITGAPGEFKTRLAAAIGRQAALQGLTLAAGNSTTADYVVQGFVSTSTSPKNVVIHVWDIETPGGQRAFRLNRETDLPADTAMIPWPIVDQQTVDKIAAETVRAILGWQSSRPAQG